jgi:serine protease Do
VGLAAVLTASLATVAMAQATDEDRPAWLGVWLSDAVDGGVQILAVVDGGPAEEAGVRSGDIVIEAGQTAVNSEAELGRVLRSMSPGQELSLKLLRAGENLELTVALGRRQKGAAAWSIRPSPPAPPAIPAPRSPGDPFRAYVYANLWNPESVGLQVTEITPALREHYGAPGEAGVLVTRVEPGQLADDAGLEVGDVLVRIGDAPISSEREVRVNLVRWNVQEPLKVQVIRASKLVDLDIAPLPPVERPERGAREPGPVDEVQRQELLKQQLELQIERLERRLAEMKKELERLKRDR